MLGTAVPNNMPTLVFFHVSAPCIHTQCVGGRPLFRVGLKPGIFPKLKSPPPQPSLLGISTALCHSTAPYGSYSYTTTTPLALWNLQLDAYPK